MSTPPTTQPTIHNIQAHDLESNERLGELFVQAVHYGFWRKTERAVLEFASLAEKALQDDTQGTPGALFYSLIKAKDVSKVTSATEARALKRFPSELRHELADIASATPTRELALEPADIQEAFTGQDIGYTHAILMQCFFPQRPIDARRYETSHGNASLVIHAGELANPNTRHEWLECQVPSGAKPRLILPYIIKEAIRTQSPDIDLGYSLRKFMGSVNIPVAGTNAKKLTAEIENIAAAQILIGEWHDNAVHTRGGRFAKQLSFWLERHPEQRAIWTPHMTLSDEFFTTIQDHRVPIDTSHLALLARSPRRMDLYAWLSYRTARIPPSKRVAISLRALHLIFGPEIERYADFSARMRRDLKAIHKVYEHFKVETTGDILWLRRSRPPVQFNVHVPARQLPPPTA